MSIIEATGLKRPRLRGYPPSRIVRAWPQWVRLAALGVAAVSAAVTSWYLYDYGRRQAGFDSATASESHSALKARIDELEAVRRNQMREMARLERSAEISLQAVDLVRAEIRETQAEMQRMSEELAFYRSIVSPQDMTPGPRIHSVLLNDTGEERRFRYRLALIQSLGQKPVKGRIQVFVDGLVDGTPRRLGLADLKAGEKGRHVMNLRSFQNIEGVMTLPEGFEPQSLTVLAVPSGKGRDQASFTATWEAALGKSAELKTIGPDADSS